MLEEVDRQIEAIGIKFQIATRLTSWVAVDERVRVTPGPSRHEVVPQEVPYGTSAAAFGLRGAAMPMQMQTRTGSISPGMNLALGGAGGMAAFGEDEGSDFDDEAPSSAASTGKFSASIDDFVADEKSEAAFSRTRAGGPPAPAQPGRPSSPPRGAPAAPPPPAKLKTMMVGSAPPAPPAAKAPEPEAPAAAAPREAKQEERKEAAKDLAPRAMQTRAVATEDKPSPKPSAAPQLTLPAAPEKKQQPKWMLALLVAIIAAILAALLWWLAL